MTLATSSRSPVTFDVQQARRDFPILSQKIHGKPLVYLDNAATTQKPRAVIDAMVRYATELGASAGRGAYREAVETAGILSECRRRLNQLFHGEDPERFIFTLNCTDGLNMAFKGVLTDGDHVITTDLEHNSVSRPLRALELAGRISLTRILGNV